VRGYRARAKLGIFEPFGFLMRENHAVDNRQIA